MLDVDDMSDDERERLEKIEAAANELVAAAWEFMWHIPQPHLPDRTMTCEYRQRLEKAAMTVTGFSSGDGYAEPTASVADVRAAVEAKGAEVGTVTGPAIVGTTDSVNAGPARRPRLDRVTPAG